MTDEYRIYQSVKWLYNHSFVKHGQGGADLENQPYDALIGRDILKSCTLIYTGVDNSYQLHL